MRCGTYPEMFFSQPLPAIGGRRGGGVGGGGEKGGGGGGVGTREV